MKINHTIRAADTKLPSINNRQPQKNDPPKLSGRFDSFTRTEEPEKKSQFNHENAELIKNLDRLSEEEKADIAFSSYLEMRKCLGLAADYKNRQLSTFDRLHEEKAYYESLLKADGKITDDYGKYAFADKHGGSCVSKEEIQTALADVQWRIDTLVQPHKGVGNDLYGRIFTVCSNVFQAATGITDDVLNLADESLWKMPDGVTYEDFKDKISDSLRSVLERTDRLQSMMKNYLNGNKHAREAQKRGLHRLHEPPERYSACLHKSPDKNYPLLHEPHGHHHQDFIPFTLNLFVNPTPKTNWDEVAMKLPQD